MATRHKWVLPPPRPSNGLKPVSSARATYQRLDNGQLKITLLHDLIKGVTPQMLLWWFRHMAGTMHYMGGEYQRYLVWHPYDHILFEVAQPGPDGGAGPGATFHIVEAFGRNPDYLFETMARVEKLDETGITLVEQRLGSEVFRLEHHFFPENAGTRYESYVTVGTASFPSMLVLNRLIHLYFFPDEKSQAWVKHNIEEVGHFEDFLPSLYAEQSES
jgi:DAPG hydrolase PhiG domain